MSREVVIVPTGTANTASVIAGLERVGARAVVAEPFQDLSQPAFVVLPGVGAFGGAAAELCDQGWLGPLRERFRAGQPTLAVCLGLQLLAEGSEESPGAAGLGVIEGAVVTRFPTSVRAPQMGWNQVEPSPGCRLLAPGWAYFANTYRLVTPPSGWATATTDYGGSFVSALERGGALACQFHPELSGSWGTQLLGRWLDRSPSLAKEALCSPSA